MTCDKCNREIKLYVSGQADPPDHVRATHIDHQYRGMWCVDCRKAAGLDARPIGEVLHEMNEQRKRYKSNARRKRQS